MNVLLTSSPLTDFCTIIHTCVIVLTIFETIQTTVRSFSFLLEAANQISEMVDVRPYTTCWPSEVQFQDIVIIYFLMHSIFLLKIQKLIVKLPHLLSL